MAGLFLQKAVLNRLRSIALMEPLSLRVSPVLPCALMVPSYLPVRLALIPFAPVVVRPHAIRLALMGL